MFSLQKILVLAAVVAAIWYGFKLINRLDRARNQKLREDDGASSARTEKRSDDEVVDLVRNPDGTYGASSDKNKDRSA